MGATEERAEKYADKHAPEQLARIRLTAEQIREVREAIARAYRAGASYARRDDA